MHNLHVLGLEIENCFLWVKPQSYVSWYVEIKSPFLGFLKRDSPCCSSLKVSHQNKSVCAMFLEIFHAFNNHLVAEVNPLS